MTQDSKFAQAIEKGTFIFTAELLPCATAEPAVIEKAVGALKDGPVAVNVADNPHGPVMSSLAGSIALYRANIEPVSSVAHEKPQCRQPTSGAAHRIKNVSACPKCPDYLIIRQWL
jgi:hypothetical protein